MKTKVMLALFVVVAVLLAGCSGQSSSSGTASDGSKGYDIANLVTKAEAEAAIGEPVTDAEVTETQPLNGQNILYVAAAETSKKTVQVTVERTKDMPEELRKSGQSAAASYDTIKEAISGPKKDISGFGDKAYWVWSGDALTLGAGLYVLAGDTYLEVAVLTGEEARDLEQSQKMAKTILDRLK